MKIVTTYMKEEKEKMFALNELLLTGTEIMEEINAEGTYFSLKTEILNNGDYEMTIEVDPAYVNLLTKIVSDASGDILSMVEALKIVMGKGKTLGNMFKKLNLLHEEIFKVEKVKVAC